MQWTEQLDVLLARGVESGLSWADVASSISEVTDEDCTPEQARSRWKRVRVVPSTRGVGATAYEVESLSEREKAEERAVVRNLRRDVAGLTAEVEELRRLTNFYDQVRTDPVEPKPWTVRPSKTGHVGIVVAQIADWHLDEVVEPEEVFGLNAYNREIARIRMGRWVDKVASLARDYVQGGRNWRGSKLLATGDLFTGDIHAGTEGVNEDHLLSSIALLDGPHHRRL